MCVRLGCWRIGGDRAVGWLWTDRWKSLRRAGRGGRLWLRALAAELARTASPQPRARRSSAAMRCAVRRQACRTVVWSRPPNCRPIAGSDSPVSSRARYIATWRGQAMRAVRAVERSSSGERPKCSQAAAWISPTELRPRRSERALARVEAVEHLARELDGQRPPGQRAEGDDADQRALERADVAS